MPLGRFAIRRWVWIGAAIVVLMTPRLSSAQAQCSYAATPAASFGAVTSFVAQASAQHTSAVTVASCGGSLLNVLVILGDTPYLRATISNSAHNFQLVNSHGDSIGYSAYAGPNGQYPLTSGTTFNYYQQPILSVLGLLGGSGGNLPMYFTTTPGGNLSAGTYSDTFSIAWSWKICNLGTVICLGYTQGSGSATVTLTLTVENSCQIASAPDIDFGSAPAPELFAPVNQSVGVLCTKGFAAYTIGLDAGQHTAGGRRRMSGAGQHLEYVLFKSATSNVWGLTGSSRITNTVDANGTSPQTFPYRAEIYTDQTTPAVGHYTDSVVLNIAW